MMAALRALGRRWAAWSEYSVKRRIFSAFVTVGFYGVLTKLFLMVKELFVAHQFGTGDAIDAYIIAYLLPAFAINVIAGSLAMVLVPALVRRREADGAAAAHRMLTGALALALVLFCVIALALVLLLPWVLPVVAAGFGPEKLRLTETMVQLLAPLVVVSGLGALTAAVLNAGGRFALAAVTPAISPLATVGMLLLAAEWMGIYALVAGALAGAMLELAVLLTGLRRAGWWFAWPGRDLGPTAQAVFSQFLPLAAGTLLMYSADLVDQAMAAMLESGSVAVLGYGNKLVAVLAGLGAAALGTAVLPHFSRLVAGAQWTTLREVLRTYAGAIVLLTVPLTAVAVWLSEPIVRLLFERGAFGPESTRLVAATQSLYLLQVPFYVLGLMGARLLSAMGRNQVLMWIGLANMLTNVAGNYILMRYLGVAGIALSTSVVYLLSMVMIALSVRHLLRAAAGNTPEHVTP